MWDIANKPEIVSLVYSLLHTVWIGAAVYVILLISLRALPARRCAARYGLCVMAFLAIPLAGLLVWSYLDIEAFLQWEKPPEVPSVPPPSSAVGFVVERVDEPVSYSEKVSMTEANPLRSTESISWEGGFFWLWILVGCFLLLKNGYAMSMANRLRRTAVPLANSDLRELFRALCAKLEMRVEPLILLSANVASPVAIGLFRSAVVLPLSMASGMPRSVAESIIAHELARICHRDNWVNALQLVARSVLFFNPFVWLIDRQIRLEREARCDLAASEASCGTIEYAEALLWCARFAREQGLSDEQAFALGALGGGEGGLKERIRRLLDSEYKSRLSVGWLGLAAALLICAFVSSLVRGGAEKVLEMMLPEARVAAMMSEVQESEQAQAENRGERWLAGRIETTDGSPVPELTRFVVSSGSDASGGQTTMSLLEIDGSVATFDIAVPFPDHRVNVFVEGYRVGSLEVAGVSVGERRDGLLIRLEPSEEAFVRIEDPQGKPVPNAVVSGWYSVLGAGIGNIQKRSDAAGMVRLFEMGTGEAHLEVRAPGYQEVYANVELSAQRTIAVSVTKPEKPSTGRVIYEDSGNPVPNARIQVISQVFLEGQHGVIASAVDRGELSADESGWFTIRHLNDQILYRIQFMDENGLRGRSIEVKAGARDLNVALPPERLLEGRIVGGAELDLARDHLRLSRLERFVNAFGEPVGSLYSWPINLVATKEGDDLVFRSDPLSAGLGYRLELGWQTIWKTGPLEAALPPLELKLDDLLGQRVEVSLRSEAMRGVLARGSIGVTFDPPFSDPVPGRFRESDRYYKRVEFDPDGVARFRSPVPMTLSFDHSGLVGFWLADSNVGGIWGRGEHLLKDRQEEPVRIQLKGVPAGMIHGALFQSDGRAAQYGNFSIIEVEPSPLIEGRSLDVIVDNQVAWQKLAPNEYRATPLPLGGVYRILASYERTRVLSDPIRIDETNPMVELDVTLPRGNELRGRVLDGRRGGVAGVDVTLECEVSGFGVLSGGGTVRSDEDGFFTVRGINGDLAARYVLVLYPPDGYARKRVALNPDNRTMRIALEPARAIRGKVVRADTGEAVSGIGINARELDMFGRPTGRELPYQTTAVSRSDGTFEFTQLSDAKYSVSLNYRGKTSVEVRAGSDEEVILERVGREE